MRASRAVPVCAGCGSRAYVSRHGSIPFRGSLVTGLLALAVVSIAPTGLQAQSTSASGVIAPKIAVQPQATPGAALITFSEYPVGTVITTQYQNLGATFSCSCFITDDAANPTSPVLSGSPLFTGPITVTFVNPNDGTTPAVATNVSFDAGYFDTVGSTQITYTDLSGATIGTVQNSQLGIEHFTAPNGIHGITLSIVGSEPAGFALDNLAFQIESLTIQAQNVTPTLNLNPEQADVGTSAAQTAHLTLGGTYQISLGYKQADGTVQAVPGTFTLGAPSLSGNLDSSALFPGNAVLQYTNQVNNAAVFQAVHQGTQQLTITPSDTTIPPAIITLSVELPASLGSTHPEFDAALYSLADDTGLPPQMIKGQIATEANFDPMTWRYEPFNATSGDFAVSTDPKDLRTQTPYSSLRLPAIGDSSDPGSCGNKYDYATHVDSRIPDPNCPGLTQGSTFSSPVMNDIAQTHYTIYIPQRDPNTGAILTDSGGNPLTRALAASDTYVSARDIFQFNDRVYHWSSFAKSSAVTQLNSGSVAFSAQLSLAASYGLLQVTYVRALDEQWTGNTGSCGATDPRDPDNLYDTACNLENGGGSLGIGTRITENNFASGSVAKSTSPSVNDEPSLEALFSNAYQLYNKKKKGYGDSVISNAQSFEPGPTGTIFTTGGQQ